MPRSISRPETNLITASPSDFARGKPAGQAMIQQYASVVAAGGATTPAAVAGAGSFAWWYVNLLLL